MIWQYANHMRKVQITPLNKVILPYPGFMPGKSQIIEMCVCMCVFTHSAGMSVGVFCLNIGNFGP